MNCNICLNNECLFKYKCGTCLDGVVCYDCNEQYCMTEMSNKCPCCRTDNKVKWKLQDELMTLYNEDIVPTKQSHKVFWKNIEDYTQTIPEYKKKLIVLDLEEIFYNTGNILKNIQEFNKNL